MENDKIYYIPALEDLRVGYECETKCYPYPDYVHTTIDDGEDIQFVKDRIWDIRTPFLTKEQVEADGWISKDVPFNDMLIWAVYFRAEKKVDDTITYSVTYQMDHQLLVQRIVTNIEGTKIPMIVFSGTCLSINEFRTILKLVAYDKKSVGKAETKEPGESPNNTEATPVV